MLRNLMDLSPFDFEGTCVPFWKGILFVLFICFVYGCLVYRGVLFLPKALWKKSCV
jgi:hypothetical protein